ncbi:thioredoxin domain-containing protein [Methylomonas sp. EFPC3]|uniref:DsbA family protein n=1 Tax=Methylomonas sp. EFPC3 TaxID=3021710 RepID=UPI0024160B02|nr:thioredoxin domain-containing protein [Methylomonas sp. EFPC3]WFP50821.1 thioredoxin domain-containing protein [Methylomonas sp. EFPC3]
MIWIKSIALIVMWMGLANIAYAEEKWVADEIFMQISEMRKEIGQLKEKVAYLEQRLADQQPKVAPVSLVGTEAMTRGKADAKLAIIEFSDYECPFCAKHYKNVLPKLLERYIDMGGVKYVMKDFPLEFHAHAKKASLATRCAGEQGQYFAMHDAIFEARGQVTDELVAEVVKNQELNMTALQACMEKPAQLSKVESDIALGSRLGVKGTPAFLIGKIKDDQLVDYRRFDGVQSFETFAGVIDGLKK